MSVHIHEAARKQMIATAEGFLVGVITHVDVEVRLVARDAAGEMVAQQTEPTVYSIAIGSFPVTLDIDAPPMQIAADLV